MFHCHGLLQRWRWGAEKSALGLSSLGNFGISHEYTESLLWLLTVHAGGAFLIFPALKHNFLQASDVAEATHLTYVTLTLKLINWAFSIFGNLHVFVKVKAGVGLLVWLFCSICFVKGECCHVRRSSGSILHCYTFVTFIFFFYDATFGPNKNTPTCRLS